jgi:hypothetical protein
LGAPHRVVAELRLRGNLVPIVFLEEVILRQRLQTFGTHVQSFEKICTLVCSQFFEHFVYQVYAPLLLVGQDCEFVSLHGRLDSGLVSTSQD